MLRSQAQISYNMSRIRSKGSIIERIFEAELRRQRVVYRKHCAIFGKPDFVNSKNKTAIFCDSSFWHGYKYGKTSRHRFKTNKRFWNEKIKANIERDKLVNKTLRKQGWKVFRFWDFQIKKDVGKCVAKVVKSLKVK
ncbi:MAG: Very short patch repair protein [Candidatus Omnitrophica bacterium ADurb.Bin277]|nr:MAG: Very short patch repair protein [Candidatus Omnitrophica bacterium ADurb.Bin277]